MKKRLLLVLAIVLTINTSSAIEDTIANRSKEIERYLKIMPVSNLLKDMTTQMAKQIPENQRQGFIDLITKHLDTEALTEAMKSSMMKHFTADECKALADFYGSKHGKSAMKKFGIYMADVMPAIQQEIIKATSKMNP